MGILLLVLGLVLFILLIITHELGHFWAARRGGVKAEEFGVFFPPRLYRRRTKAGYDFTINLLPLGGFVKLKGEHDSDTGKGSYGAAPTWTKVKIMMAGVVVNIVTALVMLTVLAWIGMPQLVDNQFTVKNDTKVSRSSVMISYVEAGSPADKAGLKVKDQLKDIGGQAVTTADNLPKITSQFAGKPTQVVYARDGKTHTTTATFLSTQAIAASKATGNPKGYLGVEPTELSLQRSTWSAPVVAVGLSAQLTALTFQGLGHALGGLGGIIAGAATGNHTARENAQTSASGQVAGPVGIFAVLQASTSLGYQYVLLIIALVALTLGIMNALPIPPLDGSHLLVTLVSRASRKRISPGMEEAIYGVGFAAFMVLAVIITIVDVKRFY